jgi:hypothetical protein
MLCPRCGTENSLEQSYCRQCGLALSAVRLTLEGRADEALEKMKNARKTLLSGTGISAMQILILILGHLIGAIGGKFLVITPFDFLVLGILSLIGMPLIIKGVVEIERANNLLNGKNKTSKSSLGHLKQSTTALPSADTVNSLDARLHFPDSVTEQTTIHLEDHRPKE